MNKWIWNFAQWYVKVFVMATGGSFVWGEFRRDSMAKFLLIQMVLFGAIGALTVMWPSFTVLDGLRLIFALVAGIAIATFCFEQVRQVVLVEGAQIGKAKFGLGVLLLAGTFGVIATTL